MLVPVSEARSVAQHTLVRHGVPDAHARIQVDLLIEAELRGLPSHGIQRLQRIVERIHNGVTNPNTVGRHDWRAEAFLHVDGEMGLGPVVALAALDAISPRARQSGLAMAAISNNNHIGMLAWYAERVAAAGQIAIVLTTSEALVHPWGGRKAMIGTNPIAIAVPALPFPFVLDMATGIVPMGKIHDYAERHQQLPPRWALDQDGNPTTDPVAAKQGAISPFGDAKGYALGLAFELLVASLTATPMGTAVRGTLDSVHPCNKGDVFIVVNPDNTGGGVGAITAYLDGIRACPPQDSAAPVTVPGDRARAARKERLTHGISVADDVWQRLIHIDDVPIAATA